MQKVLIEEQKKVNGGSHYHWKCGVNNYITGTKFSKQSDAWYYAGMHAQKYGHNGYMSVFSCVCN